MQPSTEMSADSSSPADFARSLWFELAVLACFSPLAIAHFRNLWKYEHYQYFPLILLVFPYLVWTRRSDAASQLNLRWLERSLIVVGITILGIALFFWSPNMAVLAAIIAAGGLLTRMRGNQQIVGVLSLWFVLLFLVRLPGNLDLTLIFQLQGLTSRAASLLIDAIKIDHVLLGNVLCVGDKSYFVEEACSGINSLFSLTAVTAMGVVIANRNSVHSIMLILSAAYWACMVNTIRVATLVIFNEKLGIDLLEGTPHTVFGIVLFAFAGAMVICTDQLLCVFRDREDFVRLGEDRASDSEPGENEISEDAEPDSGPSIDTFSKASLGLAGLLFIGQLASIAIGMGSKSSRDFSSSDIAFSATDLPDEIDGWKQTHFETQERDVVDYLGEKSALWHYQRGNLKVVVSLDYPFWHWHELTDCYRAQGDQLLGRSVTTSGDSDVVVAHLRGVDGTAKQLAFSLFRHSGKPLVAPPEASGIAAYGFTRFDQNLDTFLLANEPSYQVQVLATNVLVASEEVTPAIVDLQAKVASRVRQLVKRGDEEKQ